MLVVSLRNLEESNTKFDDKYINKTPITSGLRKWNYIQTDVDNLYVNYRGILYNDYTYIYNIYN